MIDFYFIISKKFRMERKKYVFLHFGKKQFILLINTEEPDGQ